jgi:hypothetical protein
MVYEGSCHCGKIAFEVDGELTGATACNCSICSRKGSLLWFVPRDKMRLLTSPADVATYTFNKHRIKHHFCRTCGIHPYAEAVDSKGNPMAAINIRCLPAVDLATVPVNNFDGKSL